MEVNKHHIKLTAQERDKIAILLASGYSILAVARELKRSPSTICEEVKNNSFEGKYYVSIHAQAKADKRKTLASILKSADLSVEEFVKLK